MDQDRQLHRSLISAISKYAAFSSLKVRRSAMNVGIQQEAIDQLGEPLHKEYVSSWCLLLPACLCLSVLMMVDDAGKQLADCRRKAGVPTKASVSPMRPNS